MLSVYVAHGTTLERIAVNPGSPPPEEAVWIDMVTPTVQEDKLVEKLLGIAVPTREEMQESKSPAASTWRTAHAT